MIENLKKRELKRSYKLRFRVGLRMNRQRNPHLSPGKTRKTIKLYSGSIYILEKMV